MLNISPENKTHVDESRYDSIQEVKKEKSSYRLMKWVTVFFIFLLVCLFLPWTQNIRSKGKLTTLRPEQRPQTINTVIGGRIEKWFVKDGDFVKKGDTILFLSDNPTVAASSIGSSLPLKYGSSLSLVFVPS
jgi:biotin carboxyl carrier protein